MHKIKNFFDRHSKDISFPGSGDHQVPLPNAPVPPVQSGPFPTEQDVFRFRKQRGVNFGSWFTLEKWIAEAPFRNAQGSSDLDVARASGAKEILEHHWDTWITEQDWAYVASKGINTIRIPIGYYHVCGADRSVIEGTDFEAFGHVYEGAWARITNAIATAYRYNIGVLIDLHAAPGKQNHDAHAGTSNPPAFFSSSKHRTNTLRALVALLTALTSFCRTHSPPLPNVVGLELLNEPAPDGQHAVLEAFYADAARALRALDPGVPLVLGDCWWTDHYADYIKAQGAHGVRGLVLDHHLYRCFTKEDGATPTAQHARALADPNGGAAKMLGAAAEKAAEAGGGLIVGEWSGALNPGSLQGVNGGAETAVRREFVEAQLALYERVCSGWFFWTYKKEHGGDRGWGWRDAVEGGVFPEWVGLRAHRAVHGDEGRAGRRDAARDKALGEHCAWWDQYKGDYEHWRFGDGFVRGWEDAYALLSTAQPGHAVSEIGMKGAWAKVRVDEHAREKGAGKGLWEFEHGLKQAIDAAKADFAQTYC